MNQFITQSGMNLILRGLTGSTIQFTKIKFGNGAAPGVTAVDLSNPLLELSITSITRDTNFITLGASFDNADVITDFSAHEIGVFATDPDDETQEILYCCWYEEDPVKADYISSVEDRILGTKLEFLVFVDSVENVTAIMAESTEFATKAALTEHTTNYSNPHKVSKADVGLSNVPNVTPENQQPVFSNTYNTISVTSSTDTAGNTLRVTSFANIVSGEKMGAILRKIRTAFFVLLTHLSSSNPHGITAKLIGAASSTHYHSATEINSGVLGLTRGGTGSNTAAGAKQNLGIFAGQFRTTLTAGTAVFVEVSYPATFNRTPFVVLTPMLGTHKNLEFGIYAITDSGFTAYVYSETFSGDVAVNWIAIA